MIKNVQINKHKISLNCKEIRIVYFFTSDKQKKTIKICFGCIFFHSDFAAQTSGEDPYIFLISNIKKKSFESTLLCT